MKKTRKHISIILFLILSLTLSILSTGCSSCSPDEEIHTCAQCKKNTTDCKQYKTDNGTELYYCKECREKCFYCGEEASKHYTNSTDVEVFVCKKHYSEIIEGEVSD